MFFFKLIKDLVVNILQNFNINYLANDLCHQKIGSIALFLYWMKEKNR